MLISTLYVSHSVIPPECAEAVVTELVELSIVKNRRQNITGALLFTGPHFAQILEGPGDAVAALMASITADDRHQKLVVLSHRAVGERQFEEWSLAYSGPSLFIARHIARLSRRPPGSIRKFDDRWLIEVMRELVTG